MKKKNIEFVYFRCKKCGTRTNQAAVGSPSVQERICFRCFVKNKYGKEALKGLELAILS